MSISELRDLVCALKQTLDPSKDVRSAGESYMMTATTMPNFLSLMVKLCVEASVEAAVRTAALIALKNTVSRYWQPNVEKDNSGDVRLCEEDRRSFREQILLLSAVISPVSLTERRLVDEIIYHILLVDYPKTWTALPMSIIELFKDRHSVLRVIAGISILVKLGRKYQLTKAETARADLAELLSACCPLLLDLVRTVKLEDLFANTETAYFCKQMSKLYYIVQHQMRNVDYFQHSYDDWMRFYAAVLHAPISPEYLNAQGPIDKNFGVKAKKWTLRIMRVSIIRYCTPRHRENSEEKVLPQMKLFQENHLLNYLQYCTKILSAHIRASKAGMCTGVSGVSGVAVGSTTQDGQIVPFLMSDVHFGIILETLGHAIEIASAYKLLKPHIPIFITEICHPALCYTEFDVEEREADPLNYAKSVALCNVSYTGGYGAKPSQAAGNLLASVMRLRSRDFLAPTTVFVQQELEAYAATNISDRGIGSSAAKRKYGVMLMLNEMAPRLTCKKRNLETVIEDLLYKHIATELQSPDPWLRSCAATVIGSMFRAWELPLLNSDGLLQVLMGVLRNCRDEDCMVRLETLRCLAVMSNLEFDTVRQFVSQYARNICELLLEMTEDFNVSESAVTALSEICENYPDQIISIAPSVLEQLVGTVGKMVNATGQSDIDLDEEQLDITLSTVVQSIVSLCCVLGRDSACADHMATIAPILEPFLNLAINPAGEDMIEDGVQCLSLVTYDIPVIPAGYWFFFDAMYQAVCGGPKPWPPTAMNPSGAWAAVELPIFTGAVDNFLVRGRDVFLTQVSTITGKAYKDEYFEMIRAGFRLSDENSNNPTSGLMLVWLLADAFSTEVDGILDVILSFCDEFVRTQLELQIEVTRTSKELLVRIYATLLAAANLRTLNEGDISQSGDAGAAVTRILSAMESRVDFGLKSWLNLLLQAKYVAMIDTKKMAIGAMAILAQRLCSEQETCVTIKDSGEEIIKALAYHTVHITRVREREKALGEDSSWDDNSEQELDENDDAAPGYAPPAVMEKLLQRGWLDDDADDDEDDDDDFMDRECTDFGERRSPYDAMSEYATCRNVLYRNADLCLRVLGEQEFNKVLEHAKTQCSSTAKAF